MELTLKKGTAWQQHSLVIPTTCVQTSAFSVLLADSSFLLACQIPKLHSAHGGWSKRLSALGTMQATTQGHNVTHI